MKNYTTIEQGEKLLELGLNPDTADMYYFCDPTLAGNIMYPTLIVVEKHLHSRLPEYNKGDIPCWSLGALLEVMPIIDDHTYHLSGTLNKGAICEHPCTCVMFQEESPIEAAYNMVCWLLESGHLK